MNEISEKARQLLAEEYEHDGWPEFADQVRNGTLSTSDMAAVNAIARALTAALPHLMGWQPIETVPKDGRMVLCWVQAFRVGEDDEGRQHEADVSECDFGAWRNNEHGGYFDAFAFPRAERESPTHWMPLPPAPTNQERGDGSITEDTK